MAGGRIAIAIGALALWLAGGAANAQTSASDYTYATRYDAERRVTGTIAPDPDGSGSLHYAAVRNTYDTTGRLTTVETGELSSWQSESVDPASWSGFTVYHQVDTDYDTMDRKTVERVSASGTTYEVTQYSYDSFGRLECTAVRMNPSTWSSLPSSACTLATTGSDGPDRITKNVYDAAGQLLQVRKGVGTSSEIADATYSYTSNGKQQDMVDAKGGHAKFVYDGFDRQVQWIFPSTTAASSYDDSTPGNALSSANTLNTSDYEQYGYDANGNRTSFRRRDGRVFTLGYDALNRVTSKVLSTTSCTLTCTTITSSQRRDVYYGYDLQGHQLFAKFDSTSGSDGVVNTYTGFGEVASSTTAMGGISRALSFQYNADGNRTRITHPDSNYFDYAYDGLDRMSTIAESGTTTIVSEVYDAQGRPASETRSGVTTTYGYDAVSRLSSIADDLPGTSADVTSGYSYNSASQINSQTRSNDSYAFSAFANVGRVYATNGLNQYATAGPATFGYDANGNLTSDGTSSFVYDAENRLVGMSGAKTSALTYDPLGRLFEITGSTCSLQYYYEGDQLVTTYLGGGGALTYRYIHGPGEDDPLIWYSGANFTKRRALQVDHQGSIVSFYQANNGAISIQSYDEYGIPGAPQFAGFGYTGQMWLDEIGMYYYKARIYSPTLGRFMQVDPIGYKDQVNLYAYVHNDPVNGRDSSGEGEIVYVGSAEEQDALRAAVKKVAESDPRLGERISTLEKSEHKHFLAGMHGDGDLVSNKPIAPAPTLDKFDLRQGDNESNGVGVSTTTLVSFEPVSLGGVGPGGKELSADLPTQIAHDLVGHGYQRDRGTLPRPASASEFDAMLQENRYRDATHQEPRLGY